jgi:hypothetical protein
MRSGTMSAMTTTETTLLAGGGRGTSAGQKRFGVCVGVLAFGASLLVCLTAASDPAGLVALVLFCPLGYVALQMGFHTRVDWSPAGVVFRRIFTTRHLPWEAITRFDVGDGGVFASRPELASWPVRSPDLQFLRADIADRLSHRSSPATRTTELLNEYREHMPAAARGAHITTTFTRPGALAVVWLATEGVLVCVSVLLITRA